MDNFEKGDIVYSKLFLTTKAGQVLKVINDDDTTILRVRIPNRNKRTDGISYVDKCVLAEDVSKKPISKEELYEYVEELRSKFVILLDGERYNEIIANDNESKMKM